MNKIRKLLNLLTSLAAIFVYSFTISIGHSFAISNQDISDILNQHTYYKEGDKTVKETCAPGTIPTKKALDPGSSVFILGDSITEGTTPNYLSLFEKAQIDLKIDASVGRSITSGGNTGNKLSGLEAVEKVDGDAIKAASAIIVGLGTNGGNNAQSMDKLIRALRANNTTATIYWIDTTVIDRADYVPIIKQSNVAIYDRVDITAISWYKTVTPTGSPTQPSGRETDTNLYINQSDNLNVHPTTKGRDALASLVYNTVMKTQPTTTTSTITGCANSTVLNGSDNESKIYNYLLDKKTLTPTQIAGIMGNLQAESHFESRLVQYGGKNSRGEISVAGQPSSLSDTLVVDGNTGYGIAQWTTSGRQQALLDFAKSRGGTAGDLTIQLDFLWQELTSIFNGSVLTPLKATNDTRTATDIVLKHFECPRACVNLARNDSPETQAAYINVLNTRYGNAQAILQKYGSV